MNPARDPDVVTVVAGLLEPLMSRGLADVLHEDRGFDLLASDLREDTIARAVAERAPHVAVLGESAEYRLLARLKSNRAAPGVVIIAREPTALSVTALAASGVVCVAQSVAVSELLDAVRHVAVRPLLTQREGEVLAHLTRDTPYAAIALDLKITVATVRTHARAIFRKLGIKNRAELIARSRQERSEHPA